MSDADASDRLAIAERLRDAREYMGLSQDEVANVLGLSRPSITNIELGVRKIEAIELNKLARLYRKTVDFLLTGQEQAPSNPEQLEFLARAVKGLAKEDLDEVARFAQFLKQSSRSK